MNSRLSVTDGDCERRDMCDAWGWRVSAVRKDIAWAPNHTISQTYSRATKAGIADAGAYPCISSERLPETGQSRAFPRSKLWPFFAALVRQGLAAKVLHNTAGYFSNLLWLLTLGIPQGGRGGKGNHVVPSTWFPISYSHVVSPVSSLVSLLIENINDTGAFTWLQKPFAGLQKQ